MARRNTSPNEVVGPALVPLGEHAGKPAFPLARSITIIGTRRSADLRLKSSTVSRAHAAIVNTTSGVYLRDLCSREGVLVNDRRIVDAELKRGDQIRIGRFTLCFIPGPEQAYDRHRRQLRPGHVVIDGKNRIDLRQRIIFIGRREASDIRLDDESVSVAHAVIFQYHGRHYLRDLGSQSGTRVNELPAKLVVLRDGDVIRVGNHELRYFTIATRADKLPAVESEPIELEPAYVATQPPLENVVASDESVDVSDSGAAIAVEPGDADFVSTGVDAPPTVEPPIPAPAPAPADEAFPSASCADIEGATLTAPTAPITDHPATDTAAPELPALPDCAQAPPERPHVAGDGDTPDVEPANGKAVHTPTVIVATVPPMSQTPDAPAPSKPSASPVSSQPPLTDAPPLSEQPDVPEADPRPPLPDGWIELAFGRQQPTPSRARQRRRRWLFWQRSQ